MRAAVMLGLFGCFDPTPPAGARCTSDASCPDGLVCSPATNTCERSASAIDAPLEDMMIGADADAPIDGPPSPFAYRRRVTIRNNASTPLTAGFTIRVPFASILQEMLDAGHVRADYADLRIVHLATEVHRIVDPITSPDPALAFALDMQIQPGATDVYTLFYGAPLATNPPDDGSQVFPVYDDFTSGISSTWLRNDAPTTSGGNLVLRAGRTDALTTTAATDDLPAVSAVELVARVVDPASAPTGQPEGTFYYWFGYQRAGDFTATDPWIVWIARDANVVRPEQKSPIGCEAECAGAATGQSSTFHHYAIERDPGATRFYRDGALRFTATVTNQADYSVMVRNYLATSNIEIDWIRARARVTPAPTIDIGDEEPVP